MNPFNNKKGLGRGLSSLIGDGDVDVKATNNKISISLIIPNKYQPRKFFEEESLKELANSIKERGIIQPLIVRKSNNHPHKFELIAGERRWQAAQNAGLHEVPVLVVEADNLKALEFAIVENIQRKDLNAVEEAEGYKKLIDDFGYDQEKVSKFIGKSRPYITNSLRLLGLPKKILSMIIEKKLSPGHAKILIGLDNIDFIADKILKKKLSVRQSENLVKVLKNPKKSYNRNIDPNINDLEKSISEKIGLSVIIKNDKRNKGSITFSYKEIDQLNKIIEIIKSHY